MLHTFQNRRPSNQKAPSGKLYLDPRKFNLDPSEPIIKRVNADDHSDSMHEFD